MCVDRICNANAFNIIPMAFIYCTFYITYIWHLRALIPIPNGTGIFILKTNIVVFKNQFCTLAKLLTASKF